MLLFVRKWIFSELTLQNDNFISLLSVGQTVSDQNSGFRPQHAVRAEHLENPDICSIW